MVIETLDGNLARERSSDTMDLLFAGENDLVAQNVRLPWFVRHPSAATWNFKA
jgi:hypothetical protein